MIMGRGWEKANRKAAGDETEIASETACNDRDRKMELEKDSLLASGGGARSTWCCSRKQPTYVQYGPRRPLWSICHDEYGIVTSTEHVVVWVETRIEAYSSLANWSGHGTCTS